MHLRSYFAKLVPTGPIVLALIGPVPAHAQLRTPLAGPAGVQVPGVPLPGTRAGADLRGADDLLRDPLALTRRLQIGMLLRQESGRVDVDPNGAPVLRGEFLAMDLSGPQRDALQAAGFALVPQSAVDATLGFELLVLRDTRGRSTAEAMRALRQAAPGASFTYQHLYLPAGEDHADRAADSASAAPGTAMRRLGLIDGGITPADPALAHARIEQHGCTPARPSPHGTAVAARLVAGDPDTLYAADLWCTDAVGGAVSGLVDALAWMARERVAVINISLVGPDNPVLARTVQAMIARGHVLVSAVGNDGPAAPPLFPAAYPQVIGVAGVDAHGRVLPESGQGEQVDFCALGVVGRGRNALRGTSFAAPVVARLAARLIDTPTAGAAERVQQQLAGEASHPAGSARDPRCGFGLLSPQT